MKIETAFNCGEKGWTFDGDEVLQLTVGQIRVEYTNSMGIRGGRIDETGIAFSNYMEQKGYKETYMCIETGIGSGRIYELGKHLFLTREDCEKACAEAIAEREREYEECKRQKIEDAQRRLVAARLEIASLEREAAQ